MSFIVLGQRAFTSANGSNATVVDRVFDAPDSVS